MLQKGLGLFEMPIDNNVYLVCLFSLTKEILSTLDFNFLFFVDYFDESPYLNITQLLYFFEELDLLFSYALLYSLNDASESASSDLYHMAVGFGKDHVF